MRAYADYNATAPLRPEARDAVLEGLGLLGNASSAHREGAAVRAALERARSDVAGLFDRPARDVVFTSGATEANVLALTGLLRPGDRLVTSRIEHASILETARDLESAGVDVVRVPVTPTGEIVADALAAALATGATLVSIALANGEVGSVAEERVLATAFARGTHVHLDAAQAVGRLRVPVDPRALISVSSHKLGGPPGVGALIVPADLSIRSLLWGGGQERGRRAGTENVPGILGFAATARVLGARAGVEAARVRALRDDLWGRLEAAIPELLRNGPPLERSLPNTLNVTLPGFTGDAMLVRLDLAGVAASLGSACAAGSPEPSHVLRAMGRDDAGARAGLRLSLGWASTPRDVETIAAAMIGIARTKRTGAAA